MVIKGIERDLYKGRGRPMEKKGSEINSSIYVFMYMYVCLSVYS